MLANKLATTHVYAIIIHNIPGCNAAGGNAKSLRGHDPAAQGHFDGAYACALLRRLVARGEPPALASLGRGGAVLAKPSSNPVNPGVPAGVPRRASFDGAGRAPTAPSMSSLVSARSPSASVLLAPADVRADRAAAGAVPAEAVRVPAMSGVSLAGAGWGESLEARSPSAAALAAPEGLDAGLTGPGVVSRLPLALEGPSVGAGGGHPETVRSPLLFAPEVLQASHAAAGWAGRMPSASGAPPAAARHQAPPAEALHPAGHSISFSSAGGDCGAELQGAELAHIVCARCEVYSRDPTLPYPTHGVLVELRQSQVWLQVLCKPCPPFFWSLFPPEESITLWLFWRACLSCHACAAQSPLCCSASCFGGACTRLRGCQSHT